MKLNNFIMASTLLFSGNSISYDFGNQIVLASENVPEQYYDVFKAFEFVYDNGNYYISNSLSVNNEQNYIPIDFKFINNLNSSFIPNSYSSKLRIENVQYVDDVLTTNFYVEVIFEYSYFSNYPDLQDSLVLGYYFDLPFSENYYSWRGAQDVYNNIKTWANDVAIINDSTITSSIFDTIKDVFGGYSATISNTFDGLMGIFYDSETNQLKPITTLLLIPVGMGILLFSYYTIKRLL